MKRILLFENGAVDFYKARIPYANFLQNNGYTVFALVPRSEYNINININIIEYDFERKNKGLFQILTLVKLLYNIIKDNKIDIIHSYRFQPNIINTLANFFNKKKVVTHITGLGIAFSNSNNKYLTLKFISYIIYHFIFLRSNKVITQNDCDFKDLDFLNLFSKKNIIIYGSGVDVNFYDPTKNISGDAGEIFFRYKNKINFLFVSRFLFEKGVMELLKGFEKASKNNPNIHLTMIGWVDKDNPRGINEDFLQNWYSKAFVTFIGKKKNLFNYYKNADCFIFPSRYREGIPRVLLEALSMKKPIITSNYPGCRLTVTNNFNGILIDPNSINQIENAIITISSNSNSNLLKMGAASRNLAISKFSSNVIFEKLLNSY